MHITYTFSWPSTNLATPKVCVLAS